LAQRDLYFGINNGYSTAILPTQVSCDGLNDRRVAARVPDRDMLQRLLVARSRDEVALLRHTRLAVLAFAIPPDPTGLEARLADAPDFRSASSDH
jgi:hypothetical protein